jgi:hypothetical protein
MLKFMIDKKPMHEERCPKCEVRLGYCLILCPLVWQCPILGLYATHLDSSVKSLLIKGCTLCLKTSWLVLKFHNSPVRKWQFQSNWGHSAFPTIISLGIVSGVWGQWAALCHKPVSPTCTGKMSPLALCTLELSSYKLSIILRGLKSADS